MSLTPRPGILEVEPYVGGESKAIGANRVIRLASNENPLGCSPEARDAYSALAGQLHRYPDGAAQALRTAIGERHGLDPAQVVCGAGSDELITLLMRAYAGPGDEILYSEHGFLMYAITARTVGAVAVAAPERNLTADVESLLARAGDKTLMLFLANPNNPTGSYLTKEQLIRLREGLPEAVLLVIDSAYAEYVEAEDYDDGRLLVERYENVVMTRTFSKIYGLAALRLGWAYCPPEVADVLNRVRGPFNVTEPAQVAGLAALQDQDFVALSRRHNTTWRNWLSEQSARLGLSVHPSAGNFLLVGFPAEPGRDAESILAALKKRGILVRGMRAYGLPECLRVGIGTEAETRAVVDALGDLLA